MLPTITPDTLDLPPGTRVKYPDCPPTFSAPGL